MNFDIQCSVTEETFGYLEKVIVTVYPRLFDILSTAQTLGNQLLDGSVCLSPLSPSISNDLNVNIDTPPKFLLTLRFSSLVHHLSGHIYTHTHTHTHTYIHTYTHTCTFYKHRYTYTHRYTQIHAHIHI